ncbi:MAG: aquaporin family protein [Chloroflexi bacterium]|nr:MAG: aquaporin family protein [Chloroflexota bacterium]
MFSIRQRALAEVFGTAALVLVGPGSVIATLALAGKAVPAVTEADLLGISFAFGFIITALVYAIGKVSGCHINPAVTFALAVTRRFPWREVPVYWVSDAPTSYYLQAALAEAIGTGLLLFAILGIVDGRSPQQLAGLVIGGAVVGIILIFGPVTGASLNPARAFGPELVQAIAGGTTYWAQYIPVYLIPGLVGAALASFVYDYLANPRHVEQPIEEAVTHEEAPAHVAAAH